MKTRTVYRCEYCRAIRYKKESMERHEAECINNPLSVNCYRCVHAYEDDWYDGLGYRTRRGACCNYIQEDITERMAHKCGGFVRSETPYYARIQKQK